MAYSLSGKVALMTGGASGIGACLVKYLLEEDVKHIAVLDIDEDAGIALQNELNAERKENKVSFIKCDVTDKEGLLKAYESVKINNGNIDVVINSAGILDDTPEGYEKEININLTSLIASSLHGWNLMSKEKGGVGGTIINFSSMAALTRLVFIPIYSATKSAVLKFSTSLGVMGKTETERVYQILAMRIRNEEAKRLVHILGMSTAYGYKNVKIKTTQEYTVAGVPYGHRALFTSKLRRTIKKPTFGERVPQDEVHYSRSGVRVITMCFSFTDTPILRNTDKLFDKGVKEQGDEFKLQNPESAAKAVVVAYKEGASGSVWFSSSDKPALDITKEHTKTIEIYDFCVYN